MSDASSVGTIVACTLVGMWMFCVAVIIYVYDARHNYLKRILGTGTVDKQADDIEIQVH